VDDVGFEAQFQIEMVRAELDEEIPVAGAADDDLLVALAEGVDETRAAAGFDRVGERRNLS